MDKNIEMDLCIPMADYLHQNFPNLNFSFTVVCNFNLFMSFLPNKAAAFFMEKSTVSQILLL